MAKRIERGPGQLQCIRADEVPVPFFKSKEMFCVGCGTAVWVCKAAVEFAGASVPVCSTCQPSIKVGAPNERNP